MATNVSSPMRGHCTCKTIAYEILAPFLCVNCCHCTWCQRETGTAFVMNAIIEAEYVNVVSETKPIFVDAPSASGDGQMMARCPKCYVVIYSDYEGTGKWMAWVRVGTLDDESKQLAKPDVHLYTSTKLQWVDLTSEENRGVPVFEQGYKRLQVWSKSANDRLDVLKEKMAAAKTASPDTAGKSEDSKA